jgi:hypothetical protein
MRGWQNSHQGCSGDVRQGQAHLGDPYPWSPRNRMRERGLGKKIPAFFVIKDCLGVAKQLGKLVGVRARTALARPREAPS